MQDTPFNRTIFGIILILFGLALIVFHKQIRKFNDVWSKYDPILRQGDWWTGKYTRGGLIITHAVTVIFGLVSLIMGVLIVFRWVD